MTRWKARHLVGLRLTGNYPETGLGRSSFRVYLKYELGVIPKAFLNMEVKALGVP